MIEYTQQEAIPAGHVRNPWPRNMVRYKHDDGRACIYCESGWYAPDDKKPWTCPFCGKADIPWNALHHCAD